MKVGVEVNFDQKYRFLKDVRPYVAESIAIPAREMNIQPIPSRYQGTPVGDYLAANSISPDGIYNHQSLAGEVLDQGQDLVLCTGTNSGKSRVFSAEAFHVVMQDPHARVLVFYPLKSLGDDQHYRWKAIAKEMGFDPTEIGKLDGKVLTVEIFKSRLERVGVPEGFIRVSAPGSIALHTPDSGVCHRIKVMEPTVLMGAPGYMVESIDRRGMFNKASRHDGGFVTVDKATLRPLEPSRTTTQGNTPSISTRFIAAAFILPLDPEKEIAMNADSGELQALYSDGSWGPYMP